MSAAYLNIARIARTHGAKGEVIAVPLQGLSLLLREGLKVALTPPALDRDRFCTIVRLSRISDSALVGFSCAHTIGEAEALVGCTVLARRDDISLSRLESPVEHLRGRGVVDARAGAIGTIREVLELPAHDVWVVSGSACGDVLIPVIDEVVANIPDEGAIDVCLTDGLLSLNG